ncbi:MAG: AAA family ATPase, partial [Desulfovibrionaceae bacterium]|nr:AAA family ATPase [Desulfovibrionaceae bacterium]
MPKIEPLSPGRLHAKLDPQRIPYEDSTQIPIVRPEVVRKNHFQPRAMQALDLALRIQTTGYNIYVSGEAGLGRTHTVLDYLRPQAKKSKDPDDLIYVYNFQNPDCPHLYNLPKGSASKVKSLFNETIKGLTKKINARFDNANFTKKRTDILRAYQSTRSEILHKMNDESKTQGFHIDFDDNGGFTIFPLVDGKRITDEDFEKLDSEVRLDLKCKGDSLAHSMSGLMRELSKSEEVYQEKEKDLEREVMTEVLNIQLEPCVQKILKLTHKLELQDYFKEVREDLIKNTELFLRKETTSPVEGPRISPLEELLTHYEINLFVNHTTTEGAPIVVEEHPTAANLLGCVEREAELGALVTNFSLIKAGSIHRANGGFLVLHMDDLLQYPNAWEGLLRALRSNEIRIEDIDTEFDSTIRTKGIMPEPLKLNLKVILIGNEYLYETLLESDERFAKLFRIKAQLA